jgi:hypothetical protein
MLRLDDTLANGWVGLTRAMSVYDLASRSLAFPANPLDLLGHRE